MLVKELIAELQKVDPSLEVFAYDETSEEWCGNFKVQVLEEEDGSEGFPYVKGDPPSLEDGQQFVVLYGEQY